MKIAMRPTPGAVGWLRVIGPGAYLQDLGHEVLFLDRTHGMTEARAREVVLDADVIHIVAPNTLFDRVQSEFHDRRGALVVDLDDDVWAWLEDPSRLEAPGPKTEARDADAVESWLRAADLVTTTTPELEAVLRAHGARATIVVPNALDPGAQRAAPRPASTIAIAPGSEPGRNAPCPCGSGTKWKRCHGRAAEKSCGKRIGWTGSIAHGRDLAPALTAIRRVASVDPQVDVVSLGPVIFTQTPEWSRPPRWEVPYHPVLYEMTPGKFGAVVPFEAYYETLESMAPDVAVVPLRPSPFNMGKSAVTPYSWGIQGVPCVMSAVGPYARARDEGFPAIYVEHEDVDAWTKALRDLLYDAPAARALGELAKAWVLEHRSFPAAAKRWEDAFRSAIALRESAKGRAAA